MATGSPPAPVFSQHACSSDDEEEDELDDEDADEDSEEDSAINSGNERTRPAQGFATFMFDVPFEDTHVELCCFLKQYIAIYVDAKTYRDMDYDRLPALARTVCRPDLNNPLGTWQLSPNYEALPCIQRLNVVCQSVLCLPFFVTHDSLKTLLCAASPSFWSWCTDRQARASRRPSARLCSRLSRAVSLSWSHRHATAPSV
jgi:hypothetical protein